MDGAPETFIWKKNGILDPKESVSKSRKAFVIAPREARILCVIDQDAEAARASHDKIEMEPIPTSPLA